MANKKLSAYTYVRNANGMNYPFIESITSFVKSGIDEVVIVDASDQEDGTTDLLLDLQDVYPDVVQIYKAEIPWTVPNFGIWDGQTKALARHYCTSDLLIQFDVDELIEETSNRSKLENYASLLNQPDLQGYTLPCPVVEYWGSSNKVRVDVNPWKWRISRNNSEITHGIPIQLRQYINGLLYAKPGTDGCDFLSKSTGEVIPMLNTFYTNQIHETRIKAITNNQLTNNYQFVKAYEKWFNEVVEKYPTIYHFSWWSVAEKIKKYRHTWNLQWHSLYNDEKRIKANWNPFFPNKPLESVSDEEINEYAKNIEEKCGGHIFHTPWQGTSTNHVVINQSYPTIIENWCNKNKTPV
jgi:hypothetical protein